MKYLFHIRGGKSIRGTTYGRTPMSFSCCSQLEHRWIYVRNIELWNWIFRVPEAQCILTLSTFFFLPFSPHSQVRYLVMLMRLAISQTQASRGGRPGDEHVIMSDHSEAIDRTLWLFSTSLTLLLFALSVLPHQAQSLPRIEKSSLGHKCTKATFFFPRMQAGVHRGCMRTHTNARFYICVHNGTHRCTRPRSFSISHPGLRRSEWCRACRRLSLMETNVDTSHPGTCSQLTHCLIKVIYWFIYERLEVAIKRVHAALTLQSGPLLISIWILMVITCLNIPSLPIRLDKHLSPMAAAINVP